MATRPKRKQAARRSGSRSAKAAPASPRERIIDAFMALVAERGLVDIGLADIAEAADVSLAELRAEFPGKLAILAAFSKRIDEAVLAQGAGGRRGGEGPSLRHPHAPPRCARPLQAGAQADGQDRAAQPRLCRGAVWHGRPLAEMDARRCRHRPWWCSRRHRAARRRSGLRRNAARVAHRRRSRSRRGP